ncbi:ImmA/IrrE family metallo-endopeptidase [Leekyejoonella antrihumi]|uniref:ImmA/IrrE family metallo-endopeptidase n=1 Tax=Leekyejoonella antrihumi TaxID=1660198 RepID=A0A563DVV5_9MICO|nr:ImmA/IrrE family metallo-endopeptidase [Leekyejoonella antrihumi]TWP34336.1 ImmA/IrrE family metallo-endopeptidase [Leekyejoonella antrihumi]
MKSLLTSTNTKTSILTSLRELTPRCQLDFEDTKAVAERQAARLLERLGIAGAHAPDVAEADIAGLPRLRIVREHLSVSGLSYWNGREWIIAVNERQGLERQRFTICHELKHIVDHPDANRLYRADWQAERAADYFAGCLLAPKPALKHMFCNVTQDRAALASHFGISQQALQVRLEQTRLIEPEVFTRTPRCARPISTPRWQRQQFRTIQPSRSYT